MVAEERSVWWLTETELDKWREVQADILAAENAALYDGNDRQLVRALYFEQWVTLDGFYNAHGLDRTREIDINPATGCITYIPFEVSFTGEE